MADEILSQEQEIENSENAQTSGNLQRCLTFESNGLVMYMSTDYVIEIINDHNITPVHLVPSYVSGIINLRGQVVPVVDIRVLMDEEVKEYTSKTCIIILTIDGTTMGIIVDNVRQVVDIDLDDVHPIPVRQRKKLLTGMLNMSDGTVAMAFDCEALMNVQM
jgi:purine-binding chemotaxis protein CheW